jgi:hypothetical protein
VAALRQEIRELTGGEDIDIVFEHPGRETFGASVYVTKKGGTITTCASTSGYLHQYDNRYFWMNLKRIVGSHFANYKESWEANRLIARASSTRRCPDLPARRDRPGGVRRAPATCTRARSACSASPPRRASASSRRPRSSGPAPRRDQPLPGRVRQHAPPVTAATGRPSDPRVALRVQRPPGWYPQQHEQH